MLILLESVQGQYRALQEGQVALEQRLDRRFEEFSVRVETRIDSLEIAVMQNGRDIRELKEAMGELRGEVDELKVEVGELKVEVGELKVAVGELKVVTQKHSEAIDRLTLAVEKKADLSVLAATHTRVDRIERHLGFQQP